MSRSCFIFHRFSDKAQVRRATLSCDSSYCFHITTFGFVDSFSLFVCLFVSFFLSFLLSCDGVLYFIFLYFNFLSFLNSKLIFCGFIMDFVEHMCASSDLARSILWYWH